MSGTKISDLPTLSVSLGSPAPARVYEAVITNDGTTATNYQAPWGIVVQPISEGAVGQGVTLIASYGGMTDGSQGAATYIAGGSVTNPGTSGYASAGEIGIYGGESTITNAAGVGVGGGAKLQSGFVTYGTISTGNAGIGATGALLYASNGLGFAGNGNILGGDLEGAGTGSRAGNVTVAAGSVISGSGDPGNVILTPGTGEANGVLLVNNIGTVDPHVLNAKWQTSIAGVGFVGVYSKG